MAARPRNCVSLSILGWLLLAEPFSAQAAALGDASLSASNLFAARVAELRSQLPPPRTHFEGVPETEAANRRRREDDYKAFLREKIQGNWFAALVSAQSDEPFAVQERFETWKELMEFLLEHDALVEVWAYPQGREAPRRIPATEMAELKKQSREQPTFITVTYRDATTSRLGTNRVEFNFKAASEVLAASAGYHRQREIQLAAFEVLGSRDAQGKLNASAQWSELGKAVQSGRLPLAKLPPKPVNPGDLFVAFEYEVDSFNNFTNVVGVYRASEIDRRVVQDSPEQAAQILVLKKSGEKESREVRGFRVRRRSDELEPAPHPVPGQDVVELRVKNLREPDVRKWNVLDFGEPELVEQSSLAKFSLISAYLEKKRKEIAVKKSRLDLIAEPIFAGLNIGGGLGALGFPIGEAARLGYNAAVVPWFIPDVPSVKQMRELFRLMAAKDKLPELRTKPSHFLDEADFKHLQESSRDLTDADVMEYLQRISDEDLRGMVRLAKMQRIDAQVSNLLSIMADAGKVSGWTDSAGFQRDVFNSIYFSVTGDVSIKNIIAVLVGGKVATPNSGFSLRTLSQGNGPPSSRPLAAWLQFLNFTVDIRAVVNTVARLSHRSLAGKELKKPFPYAPRMTDVAAYEIRVFGFPLLLFYKRGLLKDDYNSYLNDYAYGLIGATIVEHFHTREEMDAEIRAGRMIPLGYVRVPDGKGGWKETNLAVFAHRIPTGKRKGKTAIIIYGLKAYEAHSQSIEREYLRFKQFEQGLREGAVLEQLVDAEDREQLPGADFEPRLHVGAQASEELYAPLLGGLQELRRYWQRKSWGLSFDTNEVELVAGTFESFAAKDIMVEDGDPLLEVDRYNSTFRYRRLASGKRRVMQVTLIPSVAEIEREVSKARENNRIEQMRQEAISNVGDGIILLNTAKRVNDRYEIGPLLQDERGEVVGFGVRTGAKALEEMFERINQLPIADRARLQFNHFAATVVALDVAGSGRTEPVFLTIEFPLDRRFERAWINPLTGEREVLSFENGRLASVVTEHRLTEIDYDEALQERASHTYFNAGTREQPLKGALLEETRTLDIWFRNLSQPDIDPYLPLLSKLKINHVTGQTSRETYGLFPLPVSVVDDLFVMQNKFNAFGIFESGKVLDNGNTQEDFERPMLRRLLEPIAGQERFVLSSTFSQTELATLKDLKALDYKTAVERKDLLRGLTKTLLYDNAHWGRRMGESYVDSFDGTASFSLNASADYRDDFFFGLIPTRTQLKSGPNGTLMSEVKLLTCDPFSRRLTGVEVDFTGRIKTNLWDYRWEGPVEVETALRKTTQQYNRNETAVTGTNVSAASGELLGSFSGQFEPGGRTWQIQRTLWFRSGITNATETETLSGFGKLIVSRAGGAFEIRPVYDAEGKEGSRQIFRKNSANGQFDFLHRTEDDYHWREGEREARIHTFVESKPYDTFRIASDSEGRIVADGIRQFPALELRTAITFDGASDRILRAEQFRNNRLCLTRTSLAEKQQADGAWVLPVKVVPAWGLVATQTFVIGEAVPRPLSTVDENGKRVQVTEWFEATPIAKASEVSDGAGRIKERFLRSLNRGTNEGLPFDLLARLKVTHWGAAGLADEKAFLRGTDAGLFVDAGGERSFFDLSKPYEVPSFTVDSLAEEGLDVLLNRERKAHVLTVFQSRILEAPTPEQSTEPVMVLDAVDVRGLFYHQVTRQTIDRAGNILEEKTGRIPNFGDTEHSDQIVRDALAKVQLTKKSRYQYERGWLVEQSNPEKVGRALLFVTNQPATGTQSLLVNNGSREWVTEISATKAASEAELDAPAGRHPIFLRLHSPRELERNPYLPDRLDAWTAWTATELSADGKKLFDTETIYGPLRRPSAARTTKRTSSGGTATKMAYEIPAPAPGTLQEYPLPGGAPNLSLEVGNGDFSASDFIYFFLLNGTNVSISISDASGRSVRVRPGDSNFKKGLDSIWSINSAHIRWLPDPMQPEQATVVNAPASLVNHEGLVVISVHDLAKSGVDIYHLNSVKLELRLTGKLPRVSPLYRLERGADFLADEERREFSYSQEQHSSRLKTLITTDQKRTKAEMKAGLRQSSMTEWNGLPVLVTHGRTARLNFPHLILLENSDNGSPQPLYALSLEDGHLLEHYRTLKMGDSHVCTIVQGFALPQQEIFRAGILEDEVAPGFVIYGSDYPTTIRYARGRGAFSEALATLHNRIAANAFKFGGDRLSEFFPIGSPVREPLSPFNYDALHNANRQAADIAHLPMLAQALLSNRELPWNQLPLADPIVSTQQWSRVRRALLKTGSRYLEDYPLTGLVPTSPETETERYVDTVQEAGVIVLATKLGETGLAKELLDFYWDKSQGGQNALHATYDAAAGTAKAADLTSERARNALRTADAQLAMADAAFGLGLRTSESKWLTLGRNLTGLVFGWNELALNKFRAPLTPGAAPRGVCEYPFLSTRHAYGVVLWPEARLYPVRTNVRAYLLLKQLHEVLDRFARDDRWREQITDALHEEEAWLRTNIVPEVERTGVVPMGAFEIQDINRETTALGLERWTAAEDWLALLEAADAMGLPRASTQHWLENLARVHGVHVKNTWGLDWSIPLLRPDAISSEMTAKFHRLAKQFGLDQAAQFAGQNLESLKVGALFPIISTEAPPVAALQSGRGFFISRRTNQLSWPMAFNAYKELLAPQWDTANAKAPLDTETKAQGKISLHTDLTVFIFITAGFYLSILLSAIFWWRFRALRQREHAKIFPDPLVPEPVLQCAEERWAKRVLGVRTPDGAEKTRFSNAPLEQNFLLQLKAIYRLVLEWRRQENGWEENDPRLIEDEQDAWLNGLDECATLIGLYMRWVIKAGAKDGFDKPDVMTENEDSNHIWSRLVMFLSEYYWGLLTLMRNYNNLVTRPDKSNLQGEMAQLLSSLGVRQRAEGFDARKLFDFPADPAAMDLLEIQRPGMTLDKLAMEISRKLNIPYLHIVQLVERYKEFKKRESPYPLHPYLIEFAKVIPHFFLMGLGALIWYNQRIGDSPIVPYLWSVLTKFALAPASLIWALPLLAGLVLSFAAHFVKVYRFDAPMLAREKTELFLDATVTSLFIKRHSIMPKARDGRWWNPHPYQWAGWGLRVFGFVYLALALFSLETPSFATFLIVKGLLAMLVLAEVAAIALPLAGTAVSKFLQDHVTRHRETWLFTRFVNRLNITATRVASPLWLTIKYHTQPSVPTGSFWGMMQAIVFYFVFAATFFFVGGFLCLQILPLWFTDTYLQASDWKLFFGGLLFWNTMYLLRYGLFLMFTGAASMLATFPIKAALGLLAAGQALLVLLRPDISLTPMLTLPAVALALLLILLEEPIKRWLKRTAPIRPHQKPSPNDIQERLPGTEAEKSATLGIVYMSGDDLAFQKLTPDLLMDRWSILRDKLDSFGLRLLFGLANRPDDSTLRNWFEDLYAAEKASEATLWHPMQIVVGGETPPLSPDLGLNLTVENVERRDQLLTAWHLRRWLVTMMSTAGHSQDTAINLVDIALRLQREGLGANTVFYLIQNKYDNSEHNRPSQTPYHTGELNQRNKLARLLATVAPGARAYNLHDWTPFGFKAGALTGMDLVHEEALKLTTMLLLDRNATVHDLDALMEDLNLALTDPDVVIIIPGRGTTNTLTSMGQGSQMVEEGHRSFLKGLLALLGGSASEAIGTGWGNILAVSYGSMLRAMVDGHSAKMPLTSRMQRGSSFAVRAEGLIGFAPHAVGISEDTWAVSQAAHNMMALERRVKFLLSRALWHKIRETWSHSEWLASFPRWSGGYLQMMQDPLMQRINDFGPQSVFAKELRANSGRFFLSAPFALLNILLLPLAIMLDVTPFVQILILLWNFGFVMNQILTVHGLNAYLESSGFYRFPALLGAAAAGACPLFFPQLVPFAPALILTGGLAGGFLVGLSRWLYTRVRDIILFGPQLVLHALGQVVRQSLEFVVSGASPEDAHGVNMAFRAWAGPREDRPLERFPSFINLKTVIWLVGLLAVVLNLFALSNLDMLNVLLLLPSLLFSVSMLIGPFILRPRVGKPVGIWAVIPLVAAWLAAFTFLILVSMLVAVGGRWNWLGLILFSAVFALLLRQPLKYIFFRNNVRRVKNSLIQLLTSFGMTADQSVRLSSRILPQTLAGPTQVRNEMAALPADQQEAILQLVQERIQPLLKSPVQGRASVLTASRRWASEFGRSLTLALFVLLWFFIVPVPGLLAFTYDEYRFSLGVGTILLMVIGAIGLVLVAAWIGKFIQWLDRRGLGTRGLKRRLEDAYAAFHSNLATPGKLTAPAIASTFALFTDVQTYMDQRSYAYARRSLRLIEKDLAPAASEPGKAPSKLFPK